MEEGADRKDGRTGKVDCTVRILPYGTGGSGSVRTEGKYFIAYRLYRFALWFITIYCSLLYFILELLYPFRTAGAYRLYRYALCLINFIVLYLFIAEGEYFIIFHLPPAE